MNFNFDNSTSLVPTEFSALESSSQGEFSNLLPKAAQEKIVQPPKQEERVGQSKPLSQDEQEPEEQEEILQPLSPEDQRDRERLESYLKQKSLEAYYGWGQALAEIRDRKLFRSTHRAFENYCQEKYGFTRRHADYLIKFPPLMDNLMRTICSQNQPDENSIQIFANMLPTNMAQARHLFSLNTDEQQQQVWKKVLEEAKASGKDITANFIKDIVKQYKQENNVVQDKRKRKTLPENCQVGEIFTLISLEDREKKYNCHLCRIVELKDSRVIVEVRDGTLLTVNPENLKQKIDLSKAPQQFKQDWEKIRRQLPQDWERIRQLREHKSRDLGLDKILEHLGISEPLTDGERFILSHIEEYYKLDDCISAPVTS
ncbi:MAG: hypothetical protein N4J56_006986 [Chroococcidiopsis sp. SAG 2025]|uniref:hypothetical protein n=1 Tax=Chroococcidiopsis sp. SAG 2025 TaxID=171389 RepID=UPI000D05F1AB|nr:hypothetical protein [Chroococcidiopsis sp. SAG 2025]MDV2997281.1 hypothetical protein [Chroococcidiopsis sp. SAG 2025]PSB49145.1 hypothetical protein C7B80_02805 [Cyanosarcina cf. burmensis CCALA 770]